jgi:CRP-like cAMP-binding protein
VLAAGTSWRIGAATFATELAASAAIRRWVQRDLYRQLTQLADCALCLHSHLIAPRLARYLLMLHDRAPSQDIRLTHEFLATALGVRRVSITTAANEMQKGGLIEYRRGHLTVRNHAGLQAQSCTCYAAQLRATAALDQGRGRSYSRNITG